MITQNFYPFASSAFLVIFCYTAKGAGTGISISCPEIVLFHLSQVLTWLLAVSKIFLFGENYSKFSCDAGCFIFSQLHTGFGIAVIFPFSLLDVQLSGFKIISIWNKADRRGSWDSQEWKLLLPLKHKAHLWLGKCLSCWRLGKSPCTLPFLYYFPWPSCINFHWIQEIEMEIPLVWHKASGPLSLY